MYLFYYTWFCADFVKLLVVMWFLFEPFSLSVVFWTRSLHFFLWIKVNNDY